MASLFLMYCLNVSTVDSRLVARKSTKHFESSKQGFKKLI